MLRRGLILDLTVALAHVGNTRSLHMGVDATEHADLVHEKRLTKLQLGLGSSFGSLFWYGYHVRDVRKRDAYYSKLEEQRAANQAA
ncbi:hypothetical protein BP6252_03166 [Coleophoma cylindrospora]|uniref:Cytochrome c oxidase polypeptide VIIA n=1 Tax=Coleophoma cylindrospora TaxID=1849047 RepID=A0A3D8S7L8_9HELO|nr:hypothetical protein BP6252_03166 [Coleophoma cylindrospora]